MFLFFFLGGGGVGVGVRILHSREAGDGGDKEEQGPSSRERREMKHFASQESKGAKTPLDVGVRAFTTILLWTARKHVFWAPIMLKVNIDALDEISLFTFC